MGFAWTDKNDDSDLTKIDANIAAAKESSDKRAEDRAAKNDERVEQHQEVIEDIKGHLQAYADYEMV